MSRPTKERLTVLRQQFNSEFRYPGYYDLFCEIDALIVENENYRQAELSYLFSVDGREPKTLEQFLTAHDLVLGQLNSLTNERYALRSQLRAEQNKRGSQPNLFGSHAQS